MLLKPAIQSAGFHPVGKRRGKREREREEKRKRRERERQRKKEREVHGVGIKGSVYIFVLHCK